MFHNACAGCALTEVYYKLDCNKLIELIYDGFNKIYFAKDD